MKQKVTQKSIAILFFIIFLGASIIPAISGTIALHKNTILVTITEAQTVAQGKLQQLQKTDYGITEYTRIQNKNALLCYLFTLTPQGYIIVSARHDLTPVIAYSFTNDFGSLNSQTNPLLSMLSTDIQYQIDHRSSLPAEVLQERTNEWTMLAQSEFPERLFQQWPPEGSTPTGGWVLTRWTQSAPYNNFCPFLNGQRSVAGCPAVAMAQILNYHETTRDIQFTDVDDYYHAYAGNNFWIDNAYLTYQFPSWPQLNTYLDTLNDDWDQQIPLTNNDKAAVTVACGFAMHQVYNPGGSGTFGVDQADMAYQRFGFEDAELIYPSNPDLFTRLSSNIMDALPAHIAVVDPSWQSGHNMVVDGYNTDDYYHINFGWGGPYDGWYHIPNGLPYSLTVIEGVIVDILPEVHIRNLEHFPWYPSQVDSGAMTMKMMLDYCMWNSTVNPQGPVSVFDEQTLFDTYRGENLEITGDEFTTGLNAEIDDAHASPPFSYGYFFAPYASTSANDALKHICIWLDYPINYYNNLREVDVPKPGHPNHMPVATPLLGNYSRWIAIRGIFTEQNAWPIPEQLTIYGFWVNDPTPGGLGNNTYVTVNQFLDTYYQPLDVPGDIYDGQYLTITDPYTDVNQGDFDNLQVSLGVVESSLSASETSVVRLVEYGRTPQVLKEQAYILVKKAAVDQTMRVLQHENQELSIAFVQAHIVEKPVFTNGCWTIQFRMDETTINVVLDKDCNLLEFSIIV
ncbi:MAG: C10 family peptidase [Methanobacteriota archaeon]